MTKLRGPFGLLADPFQRIFLLYPSAGSLSLSAKSIIAICLVFAAAAVFAQERVATEDRVGKVETVKGLVTFTYGTWGGNAVEGDPIADGTRFVATSSGSAVLRLNNGCVIRLEPTESVVVRRDMSCKLLAIFPTGAAETAALALGSIGLVSALNNGSISSR